MKEIQFSGPDITEADYKSVQEVLESGWYAHGKYSKRFEELFTEFTGVKYAVTVSNCTAGLHLSCLLAGFQKGDEVIVPAQTHTATAHAVEYTGAKVVFADVDKLTANITVTEIEKKVNKNTKGVIPVHMAGYPCDMQEISDFCDKNKLVLIEDCAHALGTYSNKKHVGNYGLTGNFSFYPTKQITTGEGGMVISNNENVIESLRKLKAFGIETPPELRKIPGKYDVKQLGYNFRMTDIHAALGVGQMERYSENLKKRKENAEFYIQSLKDINVILFPDYNKDCSYFIFQILVDKGIDRDKLLLQLKEKGIGTSIHYAVPVPLMSYYRKKYNFNESDFPNAVNYGNNCISLPVHSKINESDIEFIANTIKQLIKS